MNRYRTCVVPILAIGFLLMTIGTASVGQNSSDALSEGFMHPPNATRPMVWWHWMNGNITKEGIAGFGVDASREIERLPDLRRCPRDASGCPHRLAYMTPEWKDAFKYATTLADQMGMEEAIASSPGWERDGRPVGPGFSRNEEVRMERNNCRGRQAV